MREPLACPRSACPRCARCRRTPRRSSRAPSHSIHARFSQARARRARAHHAPQRRHVVALAHLARAAARCAASWSARTAPSRRGARSISAQALARRRSAQQHDRVPPESSDCHDVDEGAGVVERPRHERGAARLSCRSRRRVGSTSAGVESTISFGRPVLPPEVMARTCGGTTSGSGASGEARVGLEAGRHARARSPHSPGAARRPPARASPARRSRAARPRAAAPRPAAASRRASRSRGTPRGTRCRSAARS